MTKEKAKKQSDIIKELREYVVQLKKERKDAYHVADGYRDDMHRERDRADAAEARAKNERQMSNELRVGMVNAKRIIAKLTDAAVDYVVNFHSEDGEIVKIRQSRIMGIDKPSGG